MNWGIVGIPRMWYPTHDHPTTGSFYKCLIFALLKFVNELFLINSWLWLIFMYKIYEIFICIEHFCWIIISNMLFTLHDIETILEWLVTPCKNVDKINVQKTMLSVCRHLEERMWIVKSLSQTDNTFQSFFSILRRVCLSAHTFAPTYEQTKEYQMHHKSK